MGNLLSVNPEARSCRPSGTRSSFIDATRDFRPGLSYAAMRGDDKRAALVKKALEDRPFEGFIETAESILSRFSSLTHPRPQSRY